MRIARLGEINKEKPAVLISDTEAVFVDDLITDFNRAELENGAIAKLQKADLSTRAKVRIADLPNWFTSCQANKSYLRWFELFKACI